MFNRSPTEIKDIQKMINRLDTRAEDLKKNFGEYSKYYKEYSDLFMKIGGDKNTSLGKYDNVRLKRGKTFIDSLTDEEIKKLKKLESKNLTKFHIESELKKKGRTDAEIKAYFKNDSYNQFILEHRGTIYGDENLNNFIHEKRLKSYNELDDMIERVYTLEAEEEKE